MRLLSASTQECMPGARRRMQLRWYLLQHKQCSLLGLLPVQDPELLVLFHPYLPKDKRTHTALSKAMTIDSWRRSVLKGESQVRCLACAMQASRDAGMHLWLCVPDTFSSHTHFQSTRGIMRSAVQT